jgi:serine/threonine-protein kinase SRPK3
MSSEDTNDTTEYSEESPSSDEDMTQTDNLKLSGDILKNYNIICELGRGSYSIVWLAYNISNNNFFALKVQNPAEYKDGLSEIKFVSKLPRTPNVFNNIIEHFVEIKNNKKYLCSVWELHCSNVDNLMRKGDYNNGFPIDMVKKIMKQLISSVKMLHKKFKVYHGDIKTDNILVRGINDKDAFIIKRYTEEKFFDKYKQAKETYWTSLGKNIKNIDKMDRNDKLKIRRQIHNDIVEKILEEYSQNDISKHSINSKYLEQLNVSLADFGTHCNEDDFYDEPFGTRYYQAPEIILMGKCSYPVDIWAIGCTFYELLSGKILFDPIKDSKHSRDYYHLCLMNDTCGKFSSNFLRKTKYSKKFFDSYSNIIEYHEPKENRMQRKINELELDENTKKQVLEILTNTLTIEPGRRWTIEDLSRCGFFY